jgi:MoaA/NifB/PqqE/SkfB family radical SAM enzyme
MSIKISAENVFSTEFTYYFAANGSEFFRYYLDLLISRDIIVKQLFKCCYLPQRIKTTANVLQKEVLMFIPNNLKKLGIESVVGYISKDPENNLPKLMKWIDKVTKPGEFVPQRKYFHKAIDEKDNNWHHLLMNTLNTVEPDILKKLMVNFFLNASIIGEAKKKEYREKYQCNIPWAVVIDITSACNLKCTGCWAAEYGNKLNLSFETLCNIVEQGRKLGMYMYIFTGGEPLVRKADVIRLCEKYTDCEFLAFTNGTLIDEKFADDMCRVKNFIPAISIEGNEESTDMRRGKGTYQRVMTAMKILSEHKLPFGISCCYTSQNFNQICSKQFFSDMVDMGAKFAWFFTYMPIGRAAVPELMCNAAQRKAMYEMVRARRVDTPLFTMDFWNDGAAINGCIAGGRYYFHINANGDIEPCVFAHYANCNIYKDSLLDAFHSPIFMEYKKRQPFSDNMLRPCPVLDNPGVLAEIVKVSGAHSTDVADPEPAEEYCGKCTDKALAWKPVADELWKECEAERTQKKAENKKIAEAEIESAKRSKKVPVGQKV